MGASTHTSKKHVLVVNEANHTPGCTMKSTAIRSRGGTIPSCSVLVTPHQEYCAWFGPPSSSGMLRNWRQFNNTEDLFQGDGEEDFPSWVMPAWPAKALWVPYQNSEHNNA